ncbi:uncharacterized protein PAE49_003517 [Odontesthes bonariensis]|uniref:uncharacterized protein LOC142379117 n=1 Tax=Odontesthes bonariensis TaxID=219752 RepID=UPI003F586282
MFPTAREGSTSCLSLCSCQLSLAWTISGCGTSLKCACCPHKRIMWSVLILLAASLSVESYGVRDLHERLVHGRQLKIYLPSASERLEFTPADNSRETQRYWDKLGHRLSKGRVSGTGSDRRWYIDAVTYEDQGTYVQRDYWNKEISIVKVAVTYRHNYVKCVAGESLYISLEGIDLADAALSFSGRDANVTLVRDGAQVSQDLPDYWDRVQTHFKNIEIRHVNYSDEGQYTLRDRRQRVVSVTRMDLTDHHEATGGNPLLGLLLLLGIPAGICCCCRKKIFKKKATTSATLQTSETVHPPTSGPVGPCPPYNHSGQPGQVYYHAPDSATGPTVHPPPPTAGPVQGSGPPPSPGFNPAYPRKNPCYPPQNPAYPPQNQGYPPQNPGYPPPGPAMTSPAQAQHWNYPPPNQYPPAPTAPMGCAPVMYSALPPAAAKEYVKEETKMEEGTYSPADPLLTAAPQAEAAPGPGAPADPSSTNVLSSSEGTAHQFQINSCQNSSNFL